MADDLNPNEPTTNAMREQWHKACRLIMWKLGLTEFEITADDLLAWEASKQNNIAADARSNRLVLRLMTYEEALALAKVSGGLAV